MHEKLTKRNSLKNTCSAWVGVLSLHRASTDSQMNCNPTMSKWHRAPIILMWLSFSRGRFSRLASCWGKDIRVAPCRSASSMVVPCPGILCGKPTGVPSCMGQARATANLLLKLGAREVVVMGTGVPGTVPMVS